MNEVLVHLAATVMLELAYLVAGLGLCIIGKGLLEKGITGEFLAEGERASNKLKLVTSSPGLVFLVCGLAIVLSAVYRQTEFERSVPVQVGDLRRGDSASSAGSEAGEGKTEPTMAAILQELTRYSLIADSETMRIAERLVDDARSSLAEGRRWIAVDSLAQASGLAPTLLHDLVSDDQLGPLVTSPLFEAYGRARVQIAVAAQKEKPLSARAKHAVSTLSIYALSVSPPRDLVPTYSIVQGIPTAPNQEPSAKTISRLERLLREDPRKLKEVLYDAHYKWLLEDEEILVWLEKGASKMFSNDSPQ